MNTVVMGDVDNDFFSNSSELYENADIAEVNA